MRGWNTFVCLSPKRGVIALAALLLGTCTSYASPTGALRGVNISYPPPSSEDVLRLRECPLKWDPFNTYCGLLGTRGSIRKISWMDEHLKVLEGYIEFDERGNWTRICGRGHIDFEGWNCMSAAIKDWPDVLQTQLDSQGRIVERLRDQFDKQHFVTCSYADRNTPRMSTCNDGVWTQEYSYDKSGRPLSYRRRHSHSPDETAEQARLAAVSDVAVHYIYTDDPYGNWTELRIIYDESSSIRSSDLILRRNIEYY